MRTVVLCPFSAGSVLWQAQSGAWTLSVCVRGTFSLVHGREAVLADFQEPVGSDRYAGDDPRLSLYSPSDLVPYKPRIDVVLVGSAFAPHQEPVEALVARLSLGALDKSLGIIGDRTWIEGPDGPEPSGPRPFRSMSLGYERAARGRDNPHGFDLTRAPAIGALALPNLEAVDDEIEGERTVGFGPVALTAAARRGLLRPDGWAWVEGGGRGPAPAGFDFAVYNAAPRDQQIEVLRGGELLVLENLDRSHPRLDTRLPAVRPKAFLVPGDVDKGIEIALRCDTVWIDTDRGLLTLSWRGLSTVDTPDEEALGALVIAAESKGREIGYAQIARLVRDGTGGSTDGDTFTESRPLGARVENLADLDPDLLPTPGPFRAKRVLPSIDDGGRPPSPARDAAAGSRGAPQPPVTVGDTPSPPATREGAARSSPATAERSLLSESTVTAFRGSVPSIVTTRMIDGEETSAPLSWEELTASDLVDVGSIEEPKTLTRIDLRKKLEDGALADEPSTRPMLTHPVPATDLGPRDYARIAVAVERGQAASALFDYGLTMPDLPRLTRAWSERNTADPAFAAAFAEAVQAARRG